MRRIAFENLAKGMLRYLDKCDYVKVGITALQEGGEVPLQIGITIQQVAQQAMNENGQKTFEIFWQGEKKCALLVGPDGKRNGNALSSGKEDIKTHVGNTDAELKTRNIQR